MINLLTTLLHTFHKFYSFSSDKQVAVQTPVTKTTVPHFYNQQITKVMVLDIEIDDTMKIIQKARDMIVNKV
jgi:hypothetical protein